MTCNLYARPSGMISGQAFTACFEILRTRAMAVCDPKCRTASDLFIAAKCES